MRKGSISIVILSLSWTFTFSQYFSEYDDFDEDNIDFDDTDIENETNLEPKVQKRFGSFFNQREREKYLFKKTPSLVMEQESSKVKRKKPICL